jgi:uncharacterized protein (DUF1015 family)
MAGVRPFAATRFSASFNGNLSDLLTPPYDVIDSKMQQELMDNHPNNLVRIDFGRVEPDDSEFNNRYTRASGFWKEWKQQGVLQDDSVKSYYVYEQEFQLADQDRVRRRGFFAAVKIEDFSQGGIRAHEHTFDGPKADRFRLTESTHTNLSPIFCLYDELERKIARLLQDGVAGQKPVEATIDDITHRLWVLSDLESCNQVTRLMEGRTLFIADGHHRYETSLMYQKKMRDVSTDPDGNQSYDYTLMYLNNIHDDGMIILPTHRVLSRETCMGVDHDECIQDMAEYFELEQLDIETGNLEAEAARLTQTLEESGWQSTSFLMILPGYRVWLLRMKAGVNLDEMIEQKNLPEAVRKLDVSILHQYIINRAFLGNPDLELDHDDCKYVKDTLGALKSMGSNKYGVAFLMNPTRMEQVCEVAGSGFRMPHKSTYFYPKLATGLVMRDMHCPW